MGQSGQAVFKDLFLAQAELQHGNNTLPLSVAAVFPDSGSPELPPAIKTQTTSHQA
jgi:hypothetical protein